MQNAIGAIDIGGTKIAVGLVDGNGRILDRAECPTAPERGFPDGLQRTIAMLRKTAARTGAELRGIGIGCTGPVDPFTGVLGTVDLLPGWRNGAIVAELSEAFHVPVAMENDADAAGLAEAAWGAGRGKRRFLYVTVGTGIGVAIILDGALYRGADGAHPEIGHQVIDASGPPCYCGARGCWEILASGPAILAWAKATLSLDHAGETAPAMQRLCGLAEGGDLAALAVMDRQGYYLGLGLANLVSTFCPDMIALGGGVMCSSHLFLDRARQVIRQCCTMVPFEKAELCLASLGADTALAGAAQAWHHRFGPRDSADVGQV
ncbi:MAG TPA: ROK family protein [Bryobacteraceae bacterium]|nr:ROK family protein [Bryobacteraceae bacterium]